MDNGGLVVWEINVPFQHKNRLYWGQCIGWIFSSVRLTVANDTVLVWLWNKAIGDKQSLKCINK